MTGIYQIVNKENGKIYIGSSKYIGRRIDEHFRRLRNNNHPNTHLQSSFNKYGRESFIWTILFQCEEYELLNREQELIDQFNKESLYNQTFITTGGGADVLRIPVLLLDLNGNLIKEYESLLAINEDFNIKHKATYVNYNSPSIFRRQYRIVTKDFYEKELSLILSWRNFVSMSEQERIKSKLKKKIILTIQNIEHEYDSIKEVSTLLNISGERVRQILCGAESIKYQIRYKYPELRDFKFTR